MILSGNVANEQTRTRSTKSPRHMLPRYLTISTINDPRQVILRGKGCPGGQNLSQKSLVSVELVKGNTAEGFSNIIGAPVGGIFRKHAGLGSFNPLDAFQAAFHTSRPESVPSFRHSPPKGLPRFWQNQTCWSKAARKETSWPAPKSRLVDSRKFRRRRLPPRSV